jgi:retinol dehydrogenase-12
MTQFSVVDFIRSQFLTLPPVHTVDLTGQTVVVTGSNVGLGLEAAKHLARMNPAHLIMAVRTKSKGDAALAGESIESPNSRASTLSPMISICVLTSCSTCSAPKRDRIHKREGHDP